MLTRTDAARRWAGRLDPFESSFLLSCHRSKNGYQQAEWIFMKWGEVFCDIECSLVFMV